jgi:hypothetical protein
MVADIMGVTAVGIMAGTVAGITGAAIPATADTTDCALPFLRDSSLSESKYGQKWPIHVLWQRAFRLNFQPQQLREHGGKSICLLLANYKLARKLAVYTL